MNKLDAAVFARQLIQDLPVKNEDAENDPALPERMVERCMVEGPQVAAKPYERLVKLGHV